MICKDEQLAYHHESEEHSLRMFSWQRCCICPAEKVQAASIHTPQAAYPLLVCPGSQKLDKGTLVAQHNAVTPTQYSYLS
jgi:hypothetical protein